MKLSLRDNEDVVVTLRGHWLKIVMPLVGLFLLFLVPFFFLWPLFRVGIWGALLFGALLFVVFAIAIRELYRWLKTQVVVTNARIQYTEQQGLFEHTVIEISHSKISGVTHRVKGLWQTIGGYGTVSVRLFGQERAIVIPDIPRPNEFCQLIAEFINQGGFDDIGEEWWWQRFSDMSKEEQHDFLKKLRYKIGKDKWRETFRKK